MKKIILMTMACAMCWCHIQAQTLRIDGSNYENYLVRYTTTTVPRSILLNIGVSISKNAANCRCSTPFSSLSSLIFFPNNISMSIFLL